MFKNIQIIDKTGDILNFAKTIGWKFEHNGNQYGNYISDQVPTGKYLTYIRQDEEDDEPEEVTEEIYKTIELTEQHQIKLLQTMIDTMQKLIKKNK